MDRLAPGTRFGRYEVIRELGVGDMSTYYLAADGVVLRVFHDTGPGHDEFLALGVDEAMVLTRLAHANLVRLIEAGRAEGRLFFALEYVDGPSVWHLRRARRAPWPTDASVAIALGVTAALHYLHAHPLRVIHAGVKPSTVFVTRDGVVRTNDFAKTRFTQARPGVVVTRISRYLTPEQVMGKPLDPRTDLFALGILIYELTVGQRPFDADTDFAYMVKVRDGDVAPPHEVVPAYPTALEPIVMRLLARDPERRYQSALELQRDLDAMVVRLGLDVSPGVLRELVAGSPP